MHALDVPEHQIGASDHKNLVAWPTFFPDEGTGGSNGPGGRINVDAGVLNLDLLARDYNEKAAMIWARERLPKRIDTIIIHELAEAEAGSHEAALMLAPETERPISEGTRKILARCGTGGGDASLLAGTSLHLDTSEIHARFRQPVRRLVTVCESMKRDHQPRAR